MKRSLNDAANRQVTAAVGDVARADSTERCARSWVYDEPADDSADNCDATSFDGKGAGDNPGEREPSTAHHAHIAMNFAGLNSVI